MLISRHFSLSRSGMLELLDKLESTPEDAVTLYLPSGLSTPDSQSWIAKVVNAPAIAADLAQTTATSATGGVLFWGQSRGYLILPPFPVTEKYLTHGYDTQPVCHQLQSNLRIALVLIRLGAYAIGISEGEKLITSKVGTGLIHSRHRQGGSSERRFARHRDKQIEAFFIRVCNHARQQLEPQAKTLDYIVYGGARTTISRFQKRCPFLHQFDRRQLKLLLTIPEPRQAILKTTLSHLWTTQVTQWDDSEAITDPIAPKV